ncbi:hypothetical protein [Thermus albus]|uniref:hypothetical protein n=1 Tax=Thermus albus TaxID=2908146 RepID=UPI003C12C46E
MIGAPYSSWEWRTASESYKNGVPESDRSRFVSDLSWLRHVLVEPGAQPDLVTWLQQHPDAANGVKQAVTQYLTDTEPSSPSQPWPGVRLEPVPNPNQWTDNPFTRPDIDTDGDGYPDSVEWQEANRRGVPWPDVINDPTEHPDPNGDPDGDGYPTLEEVQVGTDPYDPASNPGPRRRPWIDTDGDGYPDWQEVQEGTDPKDASSRPRVAPAPNPNQPWVDTDGDGYPDWQEISEGTDPNDPESRPSVPPAPRPEENPDKVEWPGAPPAPGLKPVEWPTRSEERKALPEVDKLIQPFEDKVLQRWRDGVREIRETAERKFPFGIIAVIRGMSISREGGNCTFTFSVGPAQGTVAPCNTPIFAVAESFRPVWAGLLWVAFALALVRRGLDIQR